MRREGASPWSCPLSPESSPLLGESAHRASLTAKGRACPRGAEPPGAGGAFPVAFSFILLAHLSG